jgi:predicted nucleic acid-binding protein
LALTYLVDTTVLTRLRVRAVVERLRELDADGLARTPLTDLEIGFSARNEEEWERLMRAVAAVDVVEIEPHHFGRARSVQRLLAQAGLKGRKVPDLLIAAVAEDRSLIVLHYDRDFDHIASVTRQPTEWVVRPGSID